MQQHQPSCWHDPEEEEEEEEEEEDVYIKAIFENHSKTC
jgi:hypothetical protein